jgi:transcription elongation factor Elf1
VYTEDKSEEDISPLYQIVQFLSGNSATVIPQELFHEGLKYNFECEVCGKEFCKKGKLKKHHKSVDNGITIRYQCDLCNSQTNSQTSLTQHRQSIHMGKKHLCQECAQQFSEKKRALLYIICQYI